MIATHQSSHRARGGSPVPPCYDLFFIKEHLDAGSRHGSQAGSLFRVTMAKRTADGSYPHFLRSLLAGHWSAFGFPSSCTLDHARKYLQQPAYCGGWLARLLTVNTERSVHVPRPPSFVRYCFLGEHRREFTCFGVEPMADNRTRAM